MSNKDYKNLKLSKLQEDVTQNCATEPPFNNEYWDNMEDGIYIDIISGEPLFTSIDKYDSGCGWPTFSNTIIKSSISKHDDYKLTYKRTEIKSRSSNSHLGHVFNDGPNNSARYCINSASIKFIHKDNLDKEGYGEFKDLFIKGNK